MVVAAVQGGSETTELQDTINDGIEWHKLIGL